LFKIKQLLSYLAILDEQRASCHAEHRRPIFGAKIEVETQNGSYFSLFAKKAFNGNWFNNTHNLNMCEGDLIELLTIATNDQLFQFNGDLYEQMDGVAMGSPLGPPLANTFTCSIEEKLTHDNKLSNFYRRYVDDTCALAPDLTAATDVLSVLNNAHPAIQFTMETAVNNNLPFAGMVITKTDNHLNTSVYRQKTNKGL